MAMNATLESGKTNRRFIILAFVLGLLGAVLVYVSFSRDTGAGGGVPGVANTAIVVAKQDIAARTKVTADMVEVKLVPVDAVSEASFTDTAKVVNQVTRFPIAANQQVLSSQVIPVTGRSGVSRALSYTIPAGKRAFAIQTSALASAGGLILPGDYIDILAVYDVQDGDDQRDAFVVQTILQNVEVLAVSQTIVDTLGGETTASPNQQRARNTEAPANPEATTLTLLVTPEQVQQLFLSERHGELRYSLRAFGDGTEKPIEFLTQPDLLPNALP
jgi:pilus assembly protein CpaB